MQADGLADNGPRQDPVGRQRPTVAGQMLRDAATRLSRSARLLDDDEDPYSQLCIALSKLLGSLADDEDAGTGPLPTAEYAVGVAQVIRSWDEDE